jgi:hypothetical protein
MNSTDKLLATCAKTLPQLPLEIIYRKYIQTSVNTHPYLTKKVKLLNTKKISNQTREYIFSNNGRVHTYCDNENDNESISAIVVHTDAVSIFVNRYSIRLEWCYRYYKPTPETIDITRKKLATAIQMLHKLYPNRLKKETPITFDCNEINKNSISLYNIYNLSMETWDREIGNLFKTKSSFCTIM